MYSFCHRSRKDAKRTIWNDLTCINNWKYMNLSKIAHSKITWYNCYSKLPGYHFGIRVWNPCNAWNQCNTCNAWNPCNPWNAWNPCNPCNAWNHCNPWNTWNPCNPWNAWSLEILATLETLGTLATLKPMQPVKRLRSLQPLKHLKPLKRLTPLQRFKNPPRRERITLDYSPFSLTLYSFL